MNIKFKQNTNDKNRQTSYVVSTAVEQLAYKNKTMMQQFENSSIPLFNKVQVLRKRSVLLSFIVYLKN